MLLNSETLKMLEVPLPKPFFLECNSSNKITAKLFFLCISLLLPNVY